MPKKILTGTIVSTGMAKTVVVEVNRLVKHPRYKKYILRSKRYLAESGDQVYQLGDRVKIQETRPLSRRKHFRVVEKLEARS